MTIITYLALGFLTSVLGALPLGTTNVAVINTTIKENIESGLKIIYTAAIAELILVIIALNFNAQIATFITMHIWLQYTIAVVLLLVGLVLIVVRKNCIKDEHNNCIPKRKSHHISKQMLGFILGLVNPTVLIYWIVVISLLNKNMIYLNTTMPYVLLILFLIGVFSGKAMTLYGYGKFSQTLKMKLNDTSSKVNRFIGGLLIFASFFQFAKLFYS